MLIRDTFGPAASLIGLLSALIIAPAHAAPTPQARLVHCGQNTCLRLSGHRPRAAVAIRVAGQQLTVSGSRNWVVTVPLATARGWKPSSGDGLTLTYLDADSKADGVQNVMLPPGALGRHLELASLVVGAP